MRTVQDIIKELRKRLRREKEYKQVLERIEKAFINAAYLNLFSADGEARQVAKQLGWVNYQHTGREFWNVIRKLVQLHCDLNGDTID